MQVVESKTELQSPLSFVELEETDQGAVHPIYTSQLQFAALK